MAIPRILFVIPGLVAGLAVPAIVAAPKPAPAGAIGMVSTDFAQHVITIHRGDRLTLFNDSNVIHVIGPGSGGRVIGVEKHVPMTGFHLMQTSTIYRTGRWETPGTYYLTCSVHPDVTLKVIVLP
jgi:plastocyanin